MERKRARRFEPAERRPDSELSPEELEAQLGEELPDREAMSVIDANVAIPANPAIAASVLAGESGGQEAPDPPVRQPEQGGEEQGREE